MEQLAIEGLLTTYPRTRPPLTEAHRQIYEDEYKLNRAGKTFFSALSQRCERWMHWRVAAGAGRGSVLEIGAGTLNHFPYEPPEKVSGYDIVEPFEKLYAGSKYRSRVRNVYHEIADIDRRERYDRIISVAVLEHLTSLPLVVAHCGVLLKDGGAFQNGIPSEGGLAWALAWRLTTGLSFRLRTGLSYSMLMRHEHVNAAPEILAIIPYFFESVLVQHFPFPTHHLSLYTYVQATVPRRDRCRRFLAEWARKMF